MDASHPDPPNALLDPPRKVCYLSRTKGWTDPERPRRPVSEVNLLAIYLGNPVWTLETAWAAVFGTFIPRPAARPTGRRQLECALRRPRSECCRRLQNGYTWSSGWSTERETARRRRELPGRLGSGPKGQSGQPLLGIDSGSDRAHQLSTMGGDDTGGGCLPNSIVAVHYVYRQTIVGER